MTTILSGQPNGTDTDVIAGTKTVTTVGDSGQMMTNQLYDIASGVLMDQQVHDEYDDQQRPRRVRFLDGTFTLTGYGCCGIDVQTNRQGIVTSYFYDALKRKTSESTLGITTSYVYDAAGRIVVTTRTGIDSSIVTLNKSAYDMAGRLVAETNGVGVVTTYGFTTDGSGQTIKTITY